jgi:hypothetical protein
MQAYPLQWPGGRPRTTYPQASRFKTAFTKVKRQCVAEIAALGGKDAIISTNIPTRQDGLPYSNYRIPQDKGVAVYFTLKGKQMCFACDRWDKVEDNLQAIHKTIEALRGIERWGSGSMVEQAFTGFLALPAPRSAHEVLGVALGAGEDEIRKAYRDKVKIHHPDAGGSAAAMQEITSAYQTLTKGKAA